MASLTSSIFKKSGFNINNNENENENRWQCNDINTNQCELITPNKFVSHRPVFLDKQSCENQCNLLSMLPLPVKNKIALHNIDSLNNLRYILPDLKRQRDNELKQSEQRMMMQSSRPFELANKLLLWDQVNELSIFSKLLDQFPDRDLVNYLWDNIKDIIVKITHSHSRVVDENNILNLLQQMFFWAKRYNITLTGKTDWIWPLFANNDLALYRLMKSHPSIGFVNPEIAADNIDHIDELLTQNYLPSKISQSLSIHHTKINENKNENKNKSELFYIDLKILGQIFNDLIWERESTKILSHLLIERINLGNDNPLDIVRIVKVLTVAQWRNVINTLDVIKIRILLNILNSEKGKQIYYFDTATFGWDSIDYLHSRSRFNSNNNNFSQLIKIYNEMNGNKYLAVLTNAIYKNKILDLEQKLTNKLNEINEMKKIEFEKFKNDIRNAINEERIDVIFYLLNENSSLLPGLIDVFRQDEDQNGLNQKKYFINDFDRIFLKTIIRDEIIDHDQERNQGDNQNENENERERLNIDSLERLKNYFNL